MMYVKTITDLDNSMISYPNYKFIFPIKALGMYAKRFGDEKIL
jgi:squalene cyclase